MGRPVKQLALTLEERIEHAEVKAWLARRPRFQIHFTPTGSSWLKLRRYYIRTPSGDGSFTSVRQLITVGEKILVKIQRARLAQAAVG
jgi:hypothetical protein